MKKYIKNGVIITEGTSITNNGKVYYNPSAEIYREFGWEEYIEPAHVKTLQEAKDEKIEAIVQYDISDNVNSFVVNGEYGWIYKADRVGLMNSTRIEKSKGKTNTYLWFNNTKLTINCDTLIDMLETLEEYALECYNVTEQHKADVLGLSTIADVEAYDITADYPIKPMFLIE